MHIYLCDRKQIENSEDAIRRFGCEYAADAGIGISKNDFESALISRSIAGKPYFPDFIGIHFSVSHSGDIWGCAFEHSPIGFDLEDMKRFRTSKMPPERNDEDFERWLKIAERFFKPEECEFVRKNGKDAFFRLWVRKEAYVKYKGIELLQGLSKIDLVADGELLSELPSAYIEELDFGRDLTGAYCAAGKRIIEKILDHRNAGI